MFYMKQPSVRPYWQQTHKLFSFICQVFYYSAGVFENSGIPTDMVQYAVLGTGLINVLMTAISVSYNLPFQLNITT